MKFFMLVGGKNIKTLVPTNLLLQNLNNSLWFFGVIIRYGRIYCSFVVVLKNEIQHTKNRRVCFRIWKQR